MKHMMRILGVAGLSSVYVMQGACQISGDGISVIPTVPGIGAFLQGLPFIGNLLT